MIAGFHACGIMRAFRSTGFDQMRSAARVIVLALALSQIQCSNAAPIGEQVKLDLIELPPGFTIEVYAQDVENVRQLALGDEGTIFAGSRKAGKVHAVVDENGDQLADRVYLIDEDLTMPSGVEFRSGSLWVGAVDRILRYDGIESRLDNPPEPVIVNDDFPDKAHHGWKYLRFGPDDRLYVPVGAPCNICDEPGFANIHRMNADGGGSEVFVNGVRNSVGLAFHPKTGNLWFTDNGRDALGDDIPSDELNHVTRPGMHFGYPYCHQGDIPDPEFGDEESCAGYSPPAANLGAHVAAIGLTFYEGDMFPEQYRGQLFIAQHGSWNRSEKVGYRIVTVDIDDDGNVTGQKVFASGWLQGEEDWGRPNDVLVMPDGSLLVSDDKTSVIYRISYDGT
jgi:glucose/arabinose dehydrogenase